MGVGLMAAEAPSEEMEHLAVGEGGEDEVSGEELHTGEPGGASPSLSAAAVCHLASGCLQSAMPLRYRVEARTVTECAYGEVSTEPLCAPQRPKLSTR